MFRTPKRRRCSSDVSSDVVTPPNNKISSTIITPDSSPVNVNGHNGSPFSPSGENKRGRPRAEVLNSLRLQGYTSPSPIKCTYCNRVFPREKSLQAHLRTHTGERPYICDYPRCTRRFAQSGQLKTHQRLHTGEKPFVCAAGQCERRFTHANRHCPEHPEVQLKRFTAPNIGSGEGGVDCSDTGAVGDKVADQQYKQDIQRWMDTVKRREPKFCAYLATPKKSHLEYEGYQESENVVTSPLETVAPREPNYRVECAAVISSATELAQCSQETKTVTQLQLLSYGFSESILKSVNQTLFPPIDVSAVTATTVLPLTPTSGYGKSATAAPRYPKKRWLREATRDSQRWDAENLQDLASPLNWDEDATVTATAVEKENRKRPTVLVRRTASGEQRKVSKADMQVAMALMELGNNTPPQNKYSF